MAHALTAVLGLILGCLTTLGDARANGSAEDDLARVHALLDGMHAAAARGEREAYLAHFTPDAVFLGTDDWERWPMDEFRRYVQQRFSKGRGWVYEARDRHIAFAGDGHTAWFDEIAVSPRWGRFRGTGVVRREQGQWRVAHYSLTALVPNESFEAVAEEIMAGFVRREQQSGIVQ